MIRMKYSRFVSVLFVICASCRLGSSSPVSTEQAIEYTIDQNTYAIMVLQEGEMSSAQAKRIARQKAAEITVGRGDRYFTIQSEGEVRILKSDKPNASDFPTNLYQEKIIEGDFGRESVERRIPPSVTPSTAYRFVFQVQADRSKRGSIDACTLTECNQPDR